MRNSNNLFKCLVLLSAVGGLGACGGGGGGNGGGANPGIAAADPLTVTSANAGAVAGTTFDATNGLTGSSDGAFGIVPAAVGRASTAQIGVIDTLIQQVRRAPTVFAGAASGVAPAAVQTVNESCDSGSLSGTFNDADGDLNLSTGDTVSLTANNCNSGGVIVNGSISVSNIVVTGDQITAPYSLQLGLQASNFSVTVGGETVVLSGDGTISEVNNDGISSITSFSGNGIQITTGGQTLTLTDYTVVATDNTATGGYSITVDATISSTGLGGSVVVTTTVALTGTGSLDPSAGQITCVGAGNTRVTLVAVDSINVQLEVDRDGDGVTDETIPATWADI
jgi:hypothetical protein